MQAKLKLSGYSKRNCQRVYVADEWLKSTRDNFPEMRQWDEDDEFEATQSSRFGFRGRAASPEITQLYLGKKILMTSERKGQCLLWSIHQILIPER